MASLDDVYEKLEDVGLKIERNTTQIENLQTQVDQIHQNMNNWTDNGCPTGRHYNQVATENRAEITRINDKVNVIANELVETKTKTTLIGAFISLIVTVFANWFTHK